MRSPFITLLLALMLFGACKKDDAVEQKPEEKDINLTTPAVLPGQLVIAQANFKPFLTDTTKVAVNGQRVAAYTNDSNQVIFIMPVLPAGKVSVDYSSVGVGKQLSLTISEYQAIEQPAMVIEAFTTTIDEVLAHFEDHVNSPVIKLNRGYLDAMKYMKEVIAESFGELMPAEQLQLAYFLQNNKPDPSQFELDELNPANYRVNAMEVDPGERLWKVAWGFKTSVVRGIAFFGVGVGLSYVPSPDLLTKLMAFGSFVTGTVYIMDALSKVEEIGNLKGLADQLADYVTGRLMGTEADELSLYKDAERSIAFRATYRNLIRNDQSSTVPVIADVFAAEKSLSKFYADILTAYNKLTSWFKKLAPTFPSYGNPVKTTASTIIYPLVGSKLVLKNVSDTAVKLTYVAKDTTLLVKATSQSLTTDRPFTFDVSYTDTKLGVTITRKVEAVYKAKRVGVTVAGGNGMGNAANQLYNPGGIALDAAGNLYVLDSDNRRIQKFAQGATEGVTVGVGYISGTTSYAFGTSDGISRDANGNLYVADLFQHVVVRVSPGSTTPVIVAGKLYEAGNTTDLLNKPRTAVVKDGYMYIADAGNHRIVKWAIGATEGVTILGNGLGSGANQFNNPREVAFDAAGNLYVCDYGNHRIQKFAPGATSGVTVAGGNGGGTAANQLFNPFSICFDGVGNLYILNYSTNAVIKWVPGASSGTVVAGGNGAGSGADQLKNPSGLAIGSDGALYISDYSNHRVQKWIP